MSDIVNLPMGAYLRRCQPVPEQMLDVKVATAGSAAGPAWAIAGVPASHGVALPAADGCGPFALAVSERLSDPAVAAVVEEVRVLQARFGGIPLPA